MSADELAGTARNIGGKIQDAVGGLTGDTSTQVRGKVNQATGQVQQAYGESVEGLRGFVSEQPMTALVMAAGIGALLGLVLARR